MGSLVENALGLGDSHRVQDILGHGLGGQLLASMLQELLGSASLLRLKRHRHRRALVEVPKERDASIGQNFVVAHAVPARLFPGMGRPAVALLLLLLFFSVVDVCRAVAGDERRDLARLRRHRRDNLARWDGETNGVDTQGHFFFARGECVSFYTTAVLPGV
jgi:hypothetical protein